MKEGDLDFEPFMSDEPHLTQSELNDLAMELSLIKTKSRTTWFKEGFTVVRYENFCFSDLPQRYEKILCTR